MFNLNYSKQPDYNLQHTMLDEMINIYGVPTILLKTERINKDDLVFGDWSHIKVDGESRFNMMALPEISETWGDMSTNFSDWGMLNLETISLFVSKKTIESIYTDINTTTGFGAIIGNLVVLNSDRIVEITDVSFEVEGTSNLFTTSAQKNVYRLTCKTYSVKSTDELPQDIIKSEEADVDYDALDQYFDELTQEKITVDTEAEVTPDENTSKPIVATDEDDVFGRF
ncbi:MAG: hypothetical protein KAI79_10140 [Bacteroidales bacterium]|nr:hypothetical protein [Bacteroidales bacterium]